VASAPRENLAFNRDHALARPWIVGTDETVLVTGANGFIGVRVVKTLIDYGFQHIRCLVRPSGRLARLQDVIRSAGLSQASVEIIEGNLLSREDCQKAARGAALVFHLAAGNDKSFAGCFMNSVLTTRNLLDALVESGTLKRLVNVSSFAVYSTFGSRRGALVDETTPLEAQPLERCDPYGYAKLKQDQIVEQYHQQFGVQYVIVRPGAVFGPGKGALSGRIGIDTFGLFLHMGGSNRIPLTYVDNCSEAIVLAGIVAGVQGEVFNVVDDDLPTSRQFLRLYKRHAGWFKSVPVPYALSYFMSAIWERYSVWSQGQLPRRFNRRRAVAEWRRQKYSNRKLKSMLGWTPRVPFGEAIRLYLGSVAKA
jgi:nucleoside-diphosphate-sugar epimerase